MDTAFVALLCPQTPQLLPYPPLCFFSLELYPLYFNEWYYVKTNFSFCFVACYDVIPSPITYLECCYDSFMIV